MRHVCTGCGTVTTRGRCRDCRPTRQSNPAYQTTAHRRRSARATARRRASDPTCPVCGRREDPAIPGTRLTLDHTAALGLGGAVDGPATVMCRSCNTRKRWRDMPRRRVLTL